MTCGDGERPGVELVLAVAAADDLASLDDVGDVATGALPGASRITRTNARPIAATAIDATHSHRRGKLADLLGEAREVANAEAAR